MHHHLRLLAAGFALAAVGVATAADDRSTAFVHVTVLPMDTERVLPDQTVVVQGDRIVAFGPSAEVEVPPAARRIEARGQFLMPGLAEMHGHNPPPGSSEQYIENVYFLFVANGVTTVRSMLGWPGQLELRDRVERGELLGPTLVLAGPSFSGNSVHSPAGAEARVREQHAEGWDLLKIHPGVRREVYDAMARTARELGMEFSGHVPADVGLEHAITSGQRTIDHLDGYIEFMDAEDGSVDPARLEAAVALTREHGAWVVPTMMLWETILGAADLETMLAYPELRYMPPEEVARWRRDYEQRTGAAGFDRAGARQVAENRRVLLKALADGGARILFGTDAPQVFSVPGFSIHRELQAMAEAGMTPYEILASATRAVGDYFGDEDPAGLIAPGQRADLILLEANPLEDVRHVARRRGVMLRGQWLPEEEIQERLQAIARAPGAGE